MKRTPSKTRRRRFFLAGISVLGSAVAIAACTYDFHAFDPAGTGGGGDEGGSTNPDAPFNGDSTAQGDTGNGDTGSPTCRADPTCLSNAVECGNNSAATQTTCKNNCGILQPPSCIATCTDQYNSRNADCRSTCNTCTRNAGCEDPIKCRDAVGGADGG